MHRKPVLGLILAVVTVGGVPSLSAQESSAPVKRGEALLSRNCARCHATGTAGLSPHPEAPPFRTLSRRYPVEGLAEALAEGLFVGHPDMPQFAFEARDVGAIIAYLKSIQER
jgi:cytochrome c